MREFRNLYAWESQSPLLRSSKVLLAGHCQGSQFSLGATPSPPATEVLSTFLARSLWTIKNNYISHQQWKTLNRWVSTRASCTLILKLQLSLISKKPQFSALETSGLLLAHQWYVIPSAGHAVENADLIGFTVSHSSWGKGKVEINCGLVSVLSVSPGLC